VRADPVVQEFAGDAGVRSASARQTGSAKADKIDHAQFPWLSLYTFKLVTIWPVRVEFQFRRELGSEISRGVR
jgi:hypothetical protein